MEIKYICPDINMPNEVANKNILPTSTKNWAFDCTAPIIRNILRAAAMQFFPITKPFGLVGADQGPIKRWECELMNQTIIY